MPPSTEDGPPARWLAWLHALWGDAAALAWQPGGEGRPVLTGREAGERVLHLGRAGDERRALAAAAHAAAHWRFGGPAQLRTGLKPVQQALYAVLEDARVEALALRELPGLRALWLPFHAAPDAPEGNGFEALLTRLARALLETAPADRHPWVVKARSMVFAPDGSLFLATREAVRAAASRLGNDIGQMRLPFNPATYRVFAAYRDDSSWLWVPEAHAPDSATVLAAPAAPDAPAAAPEPVRAEDVDPAACYPEWDARIARYRADWCRVYSREPAPLAGQGQELSPARGLTRGLRRALLALRGPAPRLSGRDRAGEDLHPVAALEARVAQRARRTPDERLYRRRDWPQAPLAVQVLLDASASTAQPGPRGRPLLAELLGAALAFSEALEAAGHRSALMSFCSRTRERVEVQPLKHWRERAASPLVLARCAAVRSAGSTRTGTAVRHAARAAQAFAGGGGSRPAVLVLTDGEVHDVDVADPAYLRGDLRQAVLEAQRAGIPVRCLQVGGRPGRGVAWRLARVPTPSGWPAALVSLLAPG